ncbi:hypothetical protein EMIT0P12_40434 [Pseudomonas sp. IT-P12]
MIVHREGSKPGLSGRRFRTDVGIFNSHVPHKSAGAVTPGDERRVSRADYLNVKPHFG